MILKVSYDEISGRNWRYVKVDDITVTKHHDYVLACDMKEPPGIKAYQVFVTTTQDQKVKFNRSSILSYHELMFDQDILLNQLQGKEDDVRMYWSCFFINYKIGDEEITLALLRNQQAYLKNDEGKTIDKL